MRRPSEERRVANSACALIPNEDDYCPCMPANGDGTYDGAGGSVLQPVASNAMTMRRMTRLNVRMFTDLIVKWSSQLSDARLPRRLHATMPSISDATIGASISAVTPLAARCNVQVISAR